MRTLYFVLFLTFTLLLSATYSSAQLTRQWTARFSGTLKNSNSSAHAIALDPIGNVYVTGWITNVGSGVDIVTSKYTSDGEFLWEKRFTSAGNAEDKPAGIVADSFNVFVTGSSAGTDYVTIKYRGAAGDTAWVRSYNGPGGGTDRAIGIVRDDSSNVYVAGWSTGSGTGIDYATLKYDSSGNLKWEQRYDGPTSKSDSALAITLRAGSTDLYVTGTSTDSLYDFATVKYNSATGVSSWASRYDAPPMGRDIARAVVARNASEVYVTGSSQDSFARYDYLTMRLNASDGTINWLSSYNGTADADDHAYAIGTSGSRVFVTGRSVNTGSYSDVTTLRYNTGSPNVQWARSYNGSANDEDVGVAMSIVGGGPTVAGSLANAGVGYDFALLEYDQSGNLDESVFYDGPVHLDDSPSAIASSNSGVILAGVSRSTTKGSQLFMIKYVEQSELKYRTLVQSELLGKGNNLKISTSIPNTANVRDEGFLAAYPKIKIGFVGYPGGLVLGNARPDSATSFGWIRFTKGSNIANFVPHTGTARGFDLYGGTPFIGQKTNPKVDKYNNHLVGELVTLRINIGASDAGVTPPMLGDLVYDDGDTSNHANGMTLRAICALTDNYLTYWKSYPAIAWEKFDTTLTRANRAFNAPLKWVNRLPLVVTGVNPIDSVPYLSPAIAPLIDPLAFPAGSLDQSPSKFTLYQNYPNPFNPVTTIAFDLAEAAVVTLRVYDILGREVGTLLDGVALDGGPQDVTFDAGALSSGMYFYRIDINEGQLQQLRKMVLMK